MSTQSKLPIVVRHALLEVIDAFEDPEQAAQAMSLSRDGLTRALAGYRINAASRRCIELALSERTSNQIGVLQKTG